MDSRKNKSILYNSTQIELLIKGVLREDEIQVGFHIEKYIRILTYVFNRWAYYRDRNTIEQNAQESKSKCNIISKEIPSSDVLPVIHFEKLATFIWRFCTELFYYYRESYSNSPEKLDEFKRKKFISSSVFEVTPAKHGRRILRVNKNVTPGCYLIDILNNFERKDISSYVKIYLDSENKASLSKHTQRSDIDHFSTIEYNLRGEDHLTYLEPSYAVTNTSDFLRDIDPLEVQNIVKLASLIEPLSRGEIRALGTHDNYKHTQEDILAEIEYLLPYLRAINNHSPKRLHYNSYKIFSFIDLSACFCLSFNFSSCNLKSFCPGT